MTGVDEPSDGALPGWRGRLKALGPGLVSGSATNDPSGVATYAQAGAQYGFGMVWAAPLVLPMTILVQEMSDRTATATGESLGRLVRRRFGRAGRAVVIVLLGCMLVANVVNVAADLMAVGQGMELLGAGPARIWDPLAGVVLLVVLINGSYRLVSKVLVVLGLALVAYVAAMFLSGVRWGDVWAGLTFAQLSPHLGFWGLVAALFGTSVSPYLFFWESGQRVEELRAEDENGDRPATDSSLPPEKAESRRKQQRFDVVTGMTASAVVMFATIVATGATLGVKHQAVSTAADAARALEPVAGSFAGTIFALGFVGTGLLGVPVLAASASMGLSAATGRDWGLDRSPRKAPLFYALLILGLAAGTVMAEFSSNVMGLLVLSAILNAIAAAPFLVVLLLVADNEQIMGERRNRAPSRILGWLTAAFMGLAGVLAVWSQLS